MNQSPVLPRNARGTIELTSVITPTCNVSERNTVINPTIDSSISQPTVGLPAEGTSPSRASAQPGRAQPIPGNTYVAKGGETLQSIAHAAYGDESLASSLAAALNRHPTRSLRKGAKLDLPEATVLIPRTPGESLDVLARSTRAR